MVKFSKQLELQMVPEWRATFCDYRKLKKELKLMKMKIYYNNDDDMNGSDEDGRNEHHKDHSVVIDEEISKMGGGHIGHDHSALKKMTGDKSPYKMFNMPITHLTRRRPLNGHPHHVNPNDNIIKVHNKKCVSHGQMEIYETEVLEPLCEDPREVSFFKGVDEELNKVNGFYASREDEYSHKLDVLKRQLTYLAEMRKTLEEQASTSSNVSCSIDTCVMPYTESPNSTPTKSLLKSDSSGNLQNETRYEMMGNHYINQIESYPEEENEIGFAESSNTRQGNVVPTSTGNYGENKGNKFKMSMLPPVLGMTQLLWDNMSSNLQIKPELDETITRKKFRYARKKLRVAFVEYYRALGLLKTFSSLNMLAFGKILKKYDKVNGRNASTPYLQALERSRLNNSNKVDYLMEEVEKLFVHNFAKDDRKKAMMLLMPAQKKPCHAITYFVGLFSGWSLAFLATFVILLHFYGAKSSDPKLQNYAKVVYPIYSVLLLIILHMFMYGWNVYLWCQYRINYPFIFEFGSRTELRSREILLVCTCLTTIIVASMVCHLIFYFHDVTLLNPTSIPFATFLVFLLLLFCPLNVFHRSSRFFFLNCMKRIFMAPFYKVTFADFFLADQLTSQVATVRQVQYIFCYYLGGQLLYHDALHACGGPQSHQYAYILSFLPYWWRLMQCLRRWNDERDSVHLANGGKYLSAMVAIGCRLSYQFYNSEAWLFIFVITSILATIYQMYWDLIKDWGLLQRESRNPWLRDQLLVKGKWVYFMSMGLNCVLRLAWLQSLTHFPSNNSDHYFLDFLFAALEVIRRGHWNFYRLENEHLNNVGKYRAVKAVPLPFRDEFVKGI